MAECIRHTELPHTTRLFTDLVYHFDRVRPYYAYPPFAFESFEDASRQIRLDAAHRKALVSALAQDNPGDAARNSLEKLSDARTLVVASGQQVGLYSGPIFTIYKALSAARLAAELSRRSIPSIPVFWLATEDHDLDEINHAWVFDASNRPVRLEAHAAADSHRPVGGIPVENASADRLQQALSGLPFGAEVAYLAASAYSNGATFGTGFKALLSRLLEPYGVLLLDPLSPAIRRLAAPIMERAIERAGELTAALLARGKELESAGYHVQVHMEEKTSLFFLLESGRRTHLRREGDAYFPDEGRPHSTAQLRQRLASHPEQFSPNALLRPVVQDFLLPTVAYIGGPAELAYLAQAEVLYRRLLGRMPVALPRATFTLLDSRSSKLMARYALTVPDVLHGQALVEQHIAETLIPPPVHRTLEAGGDQIRNALDSVQAQLLAFDPTLADALAKSRHKIEYQFSKVQAKARREAFRRAERARADAAYLVQLIFPERTLQERLYSVLPFLARHGFGLIERLHEAIRFDCPDHRVLVV